MNPLQKLHTAGQSIWLDFLRRGLITTGGLNRLVRDDAVTGVTSNPTIFGKAIGGSTDYDDAIRRFAAEGDRDPREVFYDLALGDVVMAADLFRPVYEQTRGADGFVSFELEPRLAHDTQGSIRAARELVERIGRPNVMIKVPGTREGAAAVQRLTALGINVNITLLFSVEMYEQVALAYITGLERRLSAGEPIDGLASVASFFVSRVDTAVDALLPEGSPLRGTVAIANAKRAYQRFRHLFSGERWQRLAAAGGRVQRPLWASTGTKNPAYSDVMYVELLVGPDTVNTMPEATLDAFRDHGAVRPLAVLEGAEEAETTLGLLPELELDLAGITGKLVEDGLRAFDKDLHQLLETIATKLDEAHLIGRRPSHSLGALESAVSNRLDRLQDDDVVGRIWAKDHAVWREDPVEITDRLGWLTVIDSMQERVGELETFAKQVAAEGISHAVLLGMGGSSLAAEVLRRTLGVAPEAVDLTVLDTTHPAAISALERSLDLDRTLFVVASKSGVTIETLSHFAYFYDKTRRGEQFVAIADPATPLEALARVRGFRTVFRNPPDIGGRYAALSLFGLVPAALIGADLHTLLDAGAEMAAACNRCVPCHDNPGAWLGAVLGEAAMAGRDKLTLVLPAPIADVGSWIEQLIAESTGKEGKGIVPVVGEDLAPPTAYAPDRLFLSYDAPEGLAALEASQPVVRIADVDPGRLGAEFFRWEFATAVAGHILGIHPFDQPDVTEAKQATKRILERGIEDPRRHSTPYDLRGLLEGVKPGDYVAIQAYLQPTAETEGLLQSARLAIRDRYKAATTLGFGPRFLHSTGQLHKGGPDTGVFVQVVDEAREVDLPIPGQPFTFGKLLDAQALGDLRALQASGRRVARATPELLTQVVH